MDELLLIEAVERYLKGEMTPKERTFFEEIRKNNPSIDQMVVEHTFLYNELDKQAFHDGTFECISGGVVCRVARHAGADVRTGSDEDAAGRLQGAIRE